MSASVAELVMERRNGRADCPVRQHSSRLAVAVRRNEAGEMLVYCHAGCATADVLKEGGISWSDLRAPRNREERERRELLRRATETETRRREAKLTLCCALLRSNDSFIREASEALDFLHAHGLDETELLDVLGSAYHMRSSLEADFHDLNIRRRG